jgi:molybdopterin-binding protein
MKRRPRRIASQISSYRRTARRFWKSTALHQDTNQQWRQIMKLSARNQLKGKIVDVKKSATTAHVRIDIGGQTLTASITNESADESKLEKGETAYAIIKATSVMIGVH